MLSAKLVFASLFAFVASAFAAELDLRTLKETGHNDLGLFTVVEGRHSLKLGWFKPLVGKELQKVLCGTHELWSTAGKEGHELNELLVLSKCKEAAFAVVSELTDIGGLAHHYLELDPVAGTLKKKYDGGDVKEFKLFLEAVLTALHKAGAVEALQKPYPAVAAQAGHKPELMQ
ncbi:signal peptide containing protein [Theileria equi strain WA]|uniref:Signal peptide containing protein n=1 Tax=Theileria equi strain WA TaxID=1537102 RepID=L1LET7_THEEQ|nr:signal peptide containing protein [Theileria equi strain WA]EKX73856.1 signal peptide containing protein [Theileria equi strain WA]|eukprot:XP_004833308.1 signal peptide containing protein [Theileria equi strain WA]